MNPFDQAQAMEERERDACIAAARAPKPSLEPTGHCHWCEGPVLRLFCDSDCRDDWQRAEASKARRGR